MIDKFDYHAHCLEKSVSKLISSLVETSELGALDDSCASDKLEKKLVNMHE